MSFQVFSISLIVIPSPLERKWQLFSDSWISIDAIASLFFDTTPTLIDQEKKQVHLASRLHQGTIADYLLYMRGLDIEM